MLRIIMFEMTLWTKHEFMEKYYLISLIYFIYSYSNFIVKQVLQLKDFNFSSTICFSCYMYKLTHMLYTHMLYIQFLPQYLDSKHNQSHKLEQELNSLCS